MSQKIVFYEELEQVLEHSPKYHMKILFTYLLHGAESFLRS